MSATADRPDDPKAGEGEPLSLARDLTMIGSRGQKIRTVLKTPASIRANRAIIREVFGCPDEFVEDVLEHSAKHIDDPEP